jgi:hypothetical protein
MKEIEELIKNGIDVEKFNDYLKTKYSLVVMQGDTTAYYKIPSQTYITLTEGGIKAEGDLRRFAGCNTQVEALDKYLYQLDQMYWSIRGTGVEVDRVIFRVYPKFEVCEDRIVIYSRLFFQVYT